MTPHAKVLSEERKGKSKPFTDEDHIASLKREINRLDKIIEDSDRKTVEAINIRMGNGDEFFCLSDSESRRLFTACSAI